jgi:hypothetical protein
MFSFTAYLSYCPRDRLITNLVSIISAYQLGIHPISIISPFAKVNHTVTDFLPGLEIVYINLPKAIIDKEEIQLVNSFLIRIITLTKTEKGIKKG